ncbi:hypothetical protein HY389_02380 [Candidatus Daviesbacteria bacterium]|nr:hypothetical protein [Candidatus Daviesbacteria bacterium]
MTIETETKLNRVPARVGNGYVINHNYKQLYELIAISRAEAGGFVVTFGDVNSRNNLFEMDLCSVVEGGDPKRRIMLISEPIDIHKELIYPQGTIQIVSK